MSGSSVALDTSVAIAVLAGQAGALLSQSVEEFLLPVPVIGELRYGAATAEVYARLRLGLKEKGKPIPENDLWIAALCVEHQVRPAAVDNHFDAVDGLERMTF